MNNVLVSGVQQSDSVIHIHVFILFFQILFPFRLLHNIEQSSLYDWFYFHKNNKTCFTCHTKFLGPSVGG